MPLYNITNSTTTNVYQAAFEINRLEPMLGISLLVLPFFLIILGLLSAGFSFKNSVVSAGFVTTVAALLMRAAGLVTDDILIVFIIITAGSAGLMIATRK